MINDSTETSTGAKDYGVCMSLKFFVHACCKVKDVLLQRAIGMTDRYYYRFIMEDSSISIIYTATFVMGKLHTSHSNPLSLQDPSFSFSLLLVLLLLLSHSHISLPLTASVSLVVHARNTGQTMRSKYKIFGHNSNSIMIHSCYMNDRQ